MAVTHNKENLATAIEDFSKSHVLCVGDVMLDTFIYGKVSRLSPEAPVPILSIFHEETMLGGAGNVVRNMVSLGAHVSFISVVGDDPTGNELTSIIGKENNLEPYLLTEKNRISTTKTRYISGTQHLLRVDNEKKFPVKKRTEKQILAIVESSISQANVIILSDYAKGVLTTDIIRNILERSCANNVPVVIDPKQKNFSIYAGATLLTPNITELEEASHMPVTTDTEIVSAARALMKSHDIKNMLVTRNKNGMTLIPEEGEVENFKAITQEIYDVSGAGDTVAACTAVAIGSGLDMSSAAYLANLAAGIAVTRLGTSVVYRTDMKTALFTHDMLSSTRKIMPHDMLFTNISRWKEQGFCIGFTNGCFDLIHPGHVSLLEQAKSTCDRLIVGLNSDDSVQRLKGDMRPVQDEMARAMVLASLEAVDAVVIFREDTPLELLKKIKPDILIKGADYKIRDIVGADLVQSYGGKVVLAKISEGQSTTNLIKKSTG